MASCCIVELNNRIIHDPTVTHTFFDMEEKFQIMIAMQSTGKDPMYGSMQKYMEKDPSFSASLL